MALRDLGADFERHIICEWEVNAVASYKAIHHSDDNTDYSQEYTEDQLVDILFNLGISNDGKKAMTYKQIAAKKNRKSNWLRITYNNIQSTNNIVNIMDAKGPDLRITDKDKYSYILTYSFPCQDLSVAGKQRGMKRGSGTRSGLLWEVERLLSETPELPDVLIMENVPQVIGSANIDDFHEWQKFLVNLGYTNYVEVLNAKDYGIAQNRERCFMVSLLGEYNYRFPKPIPLDKTIADYLEDEVDEKYYINTEKAQQLIATLDGKWRGRQCVDATINEPQPRDVANCLRTKERGISNRKQEGNVVCERGYIENGTGKHQSNTVYATDGIARCLQASGDMKDPMKVIVNGNKTDRKYK